MAGFGKLYCIGGLGGFEGADGINPIQMQIWVGFSSRMWLEAHYFDNDIRPIGNIKVIVPEGPDDSNMLLDACLAFYPSWFAECPSMAAVQSKLAKARGLDFDSKNEIPQEWYQLRSEASGPFRQLNIFEAELRMIRSEENGEAGSSKPSARSGVSKRKKGKKVPKENPKKISPRNGVMQKSPCVAAVAASKKTYL
jgi:hypothetical protein